MAQELFKSQPKKIYIVLEKCDDIMGCWNRNIAGNKTFHVAVSEPSYRFDFDSVMNLWLMLVGLSQLMTFPLCPTR